MVLTRIEKYDVSISTLRQSIFEISEKHANSENILLIIKPLSTLEVVREIPVGDEYRRQIINLIQNVTQRNVNEFQIEEERNPITGKPDQEHIFVKLPSKSDIDKLYNSQPYFGCLIAHKLSHVQFCPFTRHQPDLCLMCSSKKVNFVIFSFSMLIGTSMHQRYV